MTDLAKDPEGVVTRHLDHLRLRNLRRTTVYNRSRVLARLSVWADGPILYLEELRLAEWQSQRATEISPPAVRGEVSHVREFYGWTVSEGFRHDNPAGRLVMPRVPRRFPRPIPDRALAGALAGADPATCVTLSLAAFAGLRACEIAGLDWSEVALSGEYPQIRVTEGKGGHGRAVPLAPALASTLAALPHRRGPVIRRLDGRPGFCAAHRISMRANVYLHSLGIPETLHQCRHRFATATYQACRDLRAVQDLLGHASPVTTAIYAAVGQGVASEAVLRASILDAAS